MRSANGEVPVQETFSREEAFAVFAAAVAAAAGSGGVVGGFAETMYWAQRLAESRGQGVELDAPGLIHGGFAVSSGIR